MSDKKILVVYYSLEGNTEFVAEMISEKLSSDVLQLRPQSEVPKKGFMKYIIAGKQVMTKEMPSLVEYQINPDQYDLVIVGTPIWAGSFAPAIRTFFKKHNFKHSDAAVFCCHKGQPAGALGKLDDYLGPRTKEIVGKMDFYEPKSQDRAEVEQQVINFLAKLGLVTD